MTNTAKQSPLKFKTIFVGKDDFKRYAEEIVSRITRYLESVEQGLKNNPPSVNDTEYNIGEVLDGVCVDRHPDVSEQVMKYLVREVDNLTLSKRMVQIAVFSKKIGHKFYLDIDLTHYTNTAILGFKPIRLPIEIDGTLRAIIESRITKFIEVHEPGLKELPPSLNGVTYNFRRILENVGVTASLKAANAALARLEPFTVNEVNVEFYYDSEESKPFVVRLRPYEAPAREPAAEAETVPQRTAQDEVDRVYASLEGSIRRTLDGYLDASEIDYQVAIDYPSANVKSCRDLEEAILSQRTRQFKYKSASISYEVHSIDNGRAYAEVTEVVHLDEKNDAKPKDMPRLDTKELVYNFWVIVRAIDERVIKGERCETFDLSSVLAEIGYTKVSPKAVGRLMTLLTTRPPLGIDALDGIWAARNLTSLSYAGTFDGFIQVNLK